MIGNIASHAAWASHAASSALSAMGSASARHLLKQDTPQELEKQANNALAYGLACTAAGCAFAAYTIWKCCKRRAEQAAEQPQANPAQEPPAVQMAPVNAPAPAAMV